MSGRAPPFFVGYLPVPRRLRPFLWGVAGAVVILAGVLSYWVGVTQADPGPGAFRFDYGQQTVRGVVELTPLPVLHVTDGTDQVPAGRTLMLSGQGKNGVAGRAGAEDGQFVEASGVLLQRGTLDMLQLRGGQNGLAPAEGTADVPPVEELGRWRLAGEICDGKCLAGAMRPGRGLSHKACANLCIDGGVPPVFVSSQPVEGSEFLAITGPDAASIPDAVTRHMAQYISVEGRITRHGDLLVFAIEPDTIEVLP